jgi:hypothetical protein
MKVKIVHFVTSDPDIPGAGKELTILTIKLD